MTRKTISVMILVLIGVIGLTNFALAWEVTWPEIPGTEFVIGDRCPATGCPPADLPGFIAYIFTLALVTAGIVALGMLTWGAVQFVASAGFPSMRSEAKNRMTGAVTGLLLLLAVYIILNTINPELVMPGLGLGPGNFDAPIPGMMTATVSEGVFLYTSDNCDTAQNWAHYTQATPKLDSKMDNQAKAFQILDNGIMVNFWRDENFSGDVVSIEGPLGCDNNSCAKFSEVGPPDLSREVSSLNFTTIGAGIKLCKTEGPSDEQGKCEFFSYQTGEHPQDLTYEYGSNNSPDVKLLTQNYYDLTPNDHTIRDNEANWIGIGAGYYGILCYNQGTGCYYVLESSDLDYYGEANWCVNCYLGDDPGGPIADEDLTSFIVARNIDGYCEGRSNCCPCKGVIFFTGRDYNRKKGWFLTAETAAWPIGLGDASDGAPLIDLVNIRYNFTQVSGLPYEEIDDIGENLTGGITSLRLIGDCKLKVWDANGFAGNTTEFKTNIKDLRNETAGLPVGSDWEDDIRSFRLCNIDDNTTPQCAGW